MSLVVLVIGILLDKLCLLRLQVSDLLVDIHLFFVKRGFVFDAFIKEHSEIIRLMDAINQNSEQSHFLLVGELGCELICSDSNKLLLDLHHIIC